jgi:HSP20 family protein
MVTRYDPFREILSMRRAMDRLVDNSIDQNELPKAEWALALDVLEHQNEYLVRASLPGVKSEDLEVTYEKGMLTVRGEIKDESETEQGQYHLRERRFGSFVRTISMPDTIKAEDIRADYKDGVLTLHLPKAEEVKPRRIAVHTNGQN